MSQESRRLTFFFRDDPATSFSVYQEMSRQLQGVNEGDSGSWRMESNEHRLDRCHVILGERFSIPYPRLRLAPPMAWPPTNLKKRRWINYFQGSHKLTLKAPMALMLRGDDFVHPVWLPQTFVLCSDAKKRGVTDERGVWESRGGNSIWVLKPSSGCKGAGIVISDSTSTIIAHVDANPGLYVVQEYVERPLLVLGKEGGRKFDIRIWVLLAHPYRIFVFSEGSCRTSSVAYEPAEWDDLHRHITNHCVQESASAFGEHEDGNEVWLSELHAQIMQPTQPQEEDAVEKGTLRQRQTFMDELWRQIEEVVVETLLCIRPCIEVDDPRESLLEEPPGFRCFQIFGYDFIVDAAPLAPSFQVKLLEVNGSPGVAEKLLTKLVRSTIQTVLSPSSDGDTCNEPLESWRCSESEAKWRRIH